MPRGSRVCALTGSDYAMSERFQICRMFGPRPDRRRFRRGRSGSGSGSGSGSSSGSGSGSSSGTSNSTSSSGLCDIAILTTWAPRKCGIATYSSELRAALLSVCPRGSRVDVLAARWRDEANDVFDTAVVKGTVRDLEFHDLLRAGKLVNERRYHAVLVQYEFGMLYGDALVCALRSLRTPVVLVTQHTVTRVMLEFQHSLSREVHFLADRSVVMTEAMRHTLHAFHGVSPGRVVVIPHGIPQLPESSSNSSSSSSSSSGSDAAPTHFLRLRHPNSTIIMSNGLIHPFKVAHTHTHTHTLHSTAPHCTSICVSMGVYLSVSVPMSVSVFYSNTTTTPATITTTTTTTITTTTTTAAGHGAHDPRDARRAAQTPQRGVHHIRHPAPR
jgi:hypothetical protein